MTSSTRGGRISSMCISLDSYRMVCRFLHRKIPIVLAVPKQEQQMQGFIEGKLAFVLVSTNLEKAMKLSMSWVDSLIRGRLLEIFKQHPHLN